MVTPDCNKRVVTSVKGTTERFYFFEQAYKDYIANANNRAPVEIPFSDVENKLNNTYTTAFKLVLKEHNVESVEKNFVDPFNDHDVSPLVSQLRELGDKFKGGQPFVDLCVILGENDMAMKFAKQHNRKYEILELITTSSDRPVESRLEVFFSNAARQILTCHSDDSVISLRLSTEIYRAAEQIQARFEIAIAELWHSGYHWDALCLAQLKYPRTDFTCTMAVETRKFIPLGIPVEPNPSIIQSLVASVQKGAVVEVDPVLLKNENPIHLYRLFKSSMMKNELCENDFDKLAGRRNTPTRLRQIILATLIKIGPQEAALMTEDIFSYLRTNPCLLTDCFPIMHRLLFQQAIGMIADVYEAIQKAASSCTTETQDIMEKITDCWEKRDPTFWSDDRRPPLFREIGSSLAENLATILPYVESSHPVNFASAGLALSLSDKIASGTRSTIDREALAVLVHENTGIPSDAKVRITAAIQETAHPKNTAHASDEGRNIKVETKSPESAKSLESSGPSVSAIKVDSNDTFSVAPRQDLRSPVESSSVLPIGANSPEYGEDSTSSYVADERNCGQLRSSGGPKLTPGTTRLELKSGGFEDQEPSTFGQMPSYYNAEKRQERGGFRGGRGSSQFQGGRGGRGGFGGGNSGGFARGGSTGFGGGFGNS